MTEHSITFGISDADSRGTRHLTCEPAVLHVKAKDTIVFSAGGYPFSVVVKGSSPIDRTYIQNNGTDPEPSVTVQGSAGVYSLACAVYIGGKVYIDANCPSIPIDPGTSN